MNCVLVDNECCEGMLFRLCAWGVYLSSFGLFGVGLFSLFVVRLVICLFWVYAQISVDCVGFGLRCVARFCYFLGCVCILVLVDFVWCWLLLVVMILLIYCVFGYSLRCG